MNFQGQADDNVDANITPLIDVVFLLLIFFMVSTTFEHESEIQVSLPQASPNRNESDISAVKVTITPDGLVYIKDMPVAAADTEALKQQLQLAVMDIEEPMIVVNADGEASHQSVVSVMDVAHQLGIYRLSFATDIAEPGQNNVDEP